MTIGEKIMTFRKNATMSQDDLAQKLFVSRQTISQWENDQTTPTIENLIRLCEIFSISMNDFFDTIETNKGDNSIFQQALENGLSYTDSDLDIAFRAIRKYNTKPCFIRMITMSVYLIIMLLIKSYIGASLILVLLIPKIISFVIGCVRYNNWCNIHKSTYKNYIYYYSENDEYLEIYKFSRNGEIELYEKIRKNEIYKFFYSERLEIFNYKYRNYVIKKHPIDHCK